MHIGVLCILSGQRIRHSQSNYHPPKDPKNTFFTHPLSPTSVSPPNSVLLLFNCPFAFASQ